MKKEIYVAPQVEVVSFDDLREQVATLSTNTSANGTRTLASWLLG